MNCVNVNALVQVKPKWVRVLWSLNGIGKSRGGFSPAFDLMWVKRIVISPRTPEPVWGPFCKTVLNALENGAGKPVVKFIALSL